jgi:phage N-6-adenine-methyltransferase
MTHERKDGNTVNKDEARTPPSLFKKLDERWHFQVDVFATQENTLCEGYFTKDTDALLIENWISDDYNDEDELTIPDGINRFYGNCPYSNPAPFVKKAAEESLKGATVVMLLPADTACKAFHKYIMGIDYIKDANGDVVGVPNEFGASEITFLTPRVVFNNPDGTPMTGQPKFGSMVVVFKQEVFDGSPVISSMGWK